MLSVVLLVTQFALATIAIPFLNNAHSPLARRTVSIAVAAIPSDSSDLIRLADNQATNINLGDTEIALKGPGANIPDQADALSTPDSFNVAVEPSLLHPCPNSYCVCAEKYQYFPAFRVQPCHEYDPAKDPNFEKCEKINVFCCHGFNGDNVGEACWGAIIGHNYPQA